MANLKRLNRKCRKKGVKFEGLDKLPQMGGFETLKAGTSWDVVKAFNLIEMYPADQKLMTLDLGPSVRGPRYVMCAAMPFGYVNSPYAFTQLMKSPVGRMREAGIPTMIWLDDGLNLWPSVAEGTSMSALTVQVLRLSLSLGSATAVNLRRPVCGAQGSLDR